MFYKLIILSFLSFNLHAETVISCDEAKRVAETYTDAFEYLNYFDRFYIDYLISVAKDQNPSLEIREKLQSGLVPIRERMTRSINHWSFQHEDQSFSHPLVEGMDFEIVSPIDPDNLRFSFHFPPIDILTLGRRAHFISRVFDPRTTDNELGLGVEINSVAIENARESDDLISLMSWRGANAWARKINEKKNLTGVEAVVRPRNVRLEVEPELYPLNCQNLEINRVPICPPNEEPIVHSTTELILKINLALDLSGVVALSNDEAYVDLFGTQGRNILLNLNADLNLKSFFKNQLSANEETYWTAQLELISKSEFQVNDPAGVFHSDSLSEFSVPFNVLGVGEIDLRDASSIALYRASGWYAQVDLVELKIEADKIIATCELLKQL